MTFIIFHHLSIQDEAAWNVSVGDRQVAVRNICVRDSTDSLKVALWQECARVPIPPGAQIAIKDAMLTYRMNEYIATVNDIDDVDVCINMSLPFKKNLPIESIFYCSCNLKEYLRLAFTVLNLNIRKVA